MSLLPWLQHHQERAARGVAYNALRNCHANDLHSIVLHDEPGNRVRMFVTGYGHTLHRNRGSRYSLAIHPHHCDLRLVGLYGPACNDVYALVPNPIGAFAEMTYRSAIKDGEGSLTPTGRRADAHRIRHQPLSEAPKLLAHELHSIYVAENMAAAWLVIEGTEWAQYQPLCWTNDAAPSVDGLYQSMDAKEVAAMLGDVIRKLERPIA